MLNNPSTLNADVSNRKPEGRKAVLSVKGIKHGYDKTHGEVLILDDVNLTLQEGEIVALLGRSGSGKSTLLRIISGLITPGSGSVSIWASRSTGPPKASQWCFRPLRCFPG